MSEYVNINDDGSISRKDIRELGGNYNFLESILSKGNNRAVRFKDNGLSRGAKQKFADF